MKNRAQILEFPDRARREKLEPGSAQYEHRALERFAAWWNKAPAGVRRRIRQIVLADSHNQHKDTAVAVLEFFNRKRPGKRDFQPVPSNLRMICARLAEGATLRDCKAVIALKARQVDAETFDPRYFRPATLFNATRFAQYVGELPELDDE